MKIRLATGPCLETSSSGMSGLDRMDETHDAGDLSVLRSKTPPAACKVLEYSLVLGQTGEDAEVVWVVTGMRRCTRLIIERHARLRHGVVLEGQPGDEEAIC